MRPTFPYGKRFFFFRLPVVRATLEAVLLYDVIEGAQGAGELQRLVDVLEARLRVLGKSFFDSQKLQCCKLRLSPAALEREIHSAGFLETLHEAVDGPTGHAVLASLGCCTRAVLVRFNDAKAVVFVQAFATRHDAIPPTIIRSLDIYILA